AVVRPIVARRNAYCYSHRGSGLEGLVERGHRLRGPVRLRPAPADRNDRRLVRRVVDCRLDRVEEAGIGVWREVDGDLGAGRDRAGNLDVEHNLAVWSVGISRRVVFPVIDGYGEHRRLSNLQSREISLQVSGTVSAAKLDDCNALALPGAGGEIVQS